MFFVFDVVYVMYVAYVKGGKLMILRQVVRGKDSGRSPGRRICCAAPPMMPRPRSGRAPTPLVRPDTIKAPGKGRFYCILY